MKDLKGKEIDFSDEVLFPPDFMMPKKNPINEEDLRIEFEEKSEEEVVEDMAKFIRSMSEIHK